MAIPESNLIFNAVQACSPWKEPALNPKSPPTKFEPQNPKPQNQKLWFLDLVESNCKAAEVRMHTRHWCLRRRWPSCLGVYDVLALGTHFSCGTLDHSTRGKWISTTKRAATHTHTQTPMCTQTWSQTGKRATHPQMYKHTGKQAIQRRKETVNLHVLSRRK